MWSPASMATSAVSSSRSRWLDAEQLARRPAPAPTAPAPAPAAGPAPRTRTAGRPSSAARSARDQRPRVVVRGVPVVGDLGRGAAHRDQVRLGLDRLGVAGVQPGVLAGQQVVVHRLADQRVPELVAAVGVDDDQLGGDDGAQRRLERRPRRSRRPGRAARGRTAVPPTAATRSTRWAGSGSRSTRASSRSRRLSGCRRSAGSAGGGELLDEERVALGALVDGVDRSRGSGSAPSRWASISAVPSRSSRSSVEPLHAADPVELGQERPQRVAAVQLVGAVGGDQQQPCGSRAERTRKPIRSRVDRSAQCRSSSTSTSGCALGEPGEQRGDQLEEVARGGPRRRRPARRAQLGQQPGELLLAPVEDRPARRRREHSRRAAANGANGRPSSPSSRHWPVSTRTPSAAAYPAELLHQAGLADPGLAADQDGRRLGAAGAFQRVAQRGEVGLAADQDLTAARAPSESRACHGGTTGAAPRDRPSRSTASPGAVPPGLAGAGHRPNRRCRPADGAAARAGRRRPARMQLVRRAGGRGRAGTGVVCRNIVMLLAKVGRSSVLDSSPEGTGRAWGSCLIYPAAAGSLPAAAGCPGRRKAPQLDHYTSGLWQSPRRRCRSSSA